MDVGNFVSFGGRRMPPFIIKKMIIELRVMMMTMIMTQSHRLHSIRCIRLYFKRETSAALGVYQLPNHPCHACSLFYIPTQDYNISYCYIALMCG